jgi:putative acetyltransferase
MPAEFRTIQSTDDPFLASIIRNALEEYDVTRPGTVYFDDSTDHLSELFKEPGSFYYVAIEEGKVVGGSGIFPTEGLPDKTCELVKMYLNPSARGRGYGRLLIEKCIAFAKESGYTRLYLESMPELKTAIQLYEKIGFTHLTAPFGNTGHFGCDIRMIKEL